MTQDKQEKKDKEKIQDLLEDIEEEKKPHLHHEEKTESDEEKPHTHLEEE